MIVGRALTCTLNAFTPDVVDFFLVGDTAFLEGDLLVDLKVFLVRSNCKGRGSGLLLSFSSCSHHCNI